MSRHWKFSIARYFRKKPCDKYPERFIQDIDYKEVDHYEYKYEISRDRAISTALTGFNIVSKYFKLNVYGLLIIKKGYRWDGPSGPTVDTPSFMRASVPHDVFFQILREGLVPDMDREDVIEIANDELRRIALEDGMLTFRADVVHFSVDNFGTKYTKKEEKSA